MKYLMTFNESNVFSGDFLFKEINVHDFRNIENERFGITPDEVTMDKIYSILKSKIDEDIDKYLILDDTGFYQFTILHENEDNLYITPKEDDWYLVELVESEWFSDGNKEGIGYDSHFYICDQWEGLVKFLENKF